MTGIQPLLEQIGDAIAAVLPKELSEDVRKNVRSAVRGACENLDLVTREELEVQEAVLRRTREKVEVLERQIQDLEKQILRE